MRERIIELTESQSTDFCIQLWNELTMAGRAIWSDGNLSKAAQLNSLKWLNEIQHRVWNAHASAKPGALSHLIDQIISHCEQAPDLMFHVRVALDRALAAVTTSSKPRGGGSA